MSKTEQVFDLSTDETFSVDASGTPLPEPPGYEKYIQLQHEEEVGFDMKNEFDDTWMPGNWWAEVVTG